MDLPNINLAELDLVALKSWLLPQVSWTDFDPATQSRLLAELSWQGLDSAAQEQLLADGFRWMREHNGGKLPLRAYLESVLTIARPYVDVAPVYLHLDGGYEILLVRRPDTDAIFPGHWHIAGGATLGRQTVVEKRKELLSHDCGAGSASVEFLFAGQISMPKTKLEIAQVTIFLALTQEKWQAPVDAGWFRLDNLPEPMVPHQTAAYFPLIRRVLAGGEPEFMEHLAE